MLTSPALNRRRLLLGLASASASGAAIVAAGATVGVAVVDTAKGSEPVENLALIALGDELAPALAELKAARAAYWSMVDKWEPQWPSAPDAITMEHPRAARIGAWDDEEKGFQGRSVMPDGAYYRVPSGETFGAPHPKHRLVVKSAEFDRQVRCLDGDMKRKRPKNPLTPDQLMTLEARRAIAVDCLTAAREYEARCSEILRLSDFEAVKVRRYASLQAAHEVIGRVMSEKPVTMAGVLIQAEALAASKLTEGHHMIGAYEWSADFAKALLRIAGEALPAQA